MLNSSTPPSTSPAQNRRRQRPASATRRTALNRAAPHRASGPLEVRPVATAAEFKTFARFPWIVYRHDELWTPPLVSYQMARLNQRKASSWRYMEGEYYIAWRGNQPVGTIAAFVNHRHNLFHGERVAFFGAFEALDDQPAANLLLETAARYALRRGCTALRGPANFSINYELGLLTHPIDDVPVMEMPYNAPYYDRLIRSAPGFGPLMGLSSYHITLDQWQQSGKVAQAMRVTHKNSARRGISVRTLDPRHLRRDVNIICELYNTAWDNNWSFVPLTATELAEWARDMRHYVVPELTFFGMVHGRPVGFLMAFPDINQALHRARPRPGKPEVISQLQTWWHAKARSKITRIRIPILGVQAPYRGTGVESAMFVALYEQAQKLQARTGWQSADAGWVLEVNSPMRRILESFGADEYRHFQLYERALAPTVHAAQQREMLQHARQRLSAPPAPERRVAVSLPLRQPAIRVPNRPRASVKNGARANSRARGQSKPANPRRAARVRRASSRLRRVRSGS